MAKRKRRRKTLRSKLTAIAVLAVLCAAATLAAVSIGSVRYSIPEVLDAFRGPDAKAWLLVWNVRLPRVICGGLVGVCLSLSGCILQGVMRNHLASPSTIGVTSGAGFVGYLVLVAFPQLRALLPVGVIAGSFAATMLIYLLAYARGVSPVRMILAGMAVSAMFGAFSDIIRSFFSDRLGNAVGYFVGSLNGTTWDDLRLILPYMLAGMAVCFFLPVNMNVLMLGDETARSLGLDVERFRLFLIATASLLAGASVAVAGMVGFVGLIVPHIARILVGSDYRFLFPTSIFLGYAFVVACDTVGRVVLPVGELSVSVVLAFIGAPFFLWLLRKKNAM